MDQFCDSDRMSDVVAAVRLVKPYVDPKWVGSMLCENEEFISSIQTATKWYVDGLSYEEWLKSAPTEDISEFVLEFIDSYIEMYDLEDEDV